MNADCGHFDSYLIMEHEVLQSTSFSNVLLNCYKMRRRTSGSRFLKNIRSLFKT